MRIADKEMKGKNYDLYTYRRIRRAIGYLGISLPMLLIALSLIPFFKTAIQPSISAYYYTNLRDIFVGSLCAVGLFLLRYKGNGNVLIWKNDNLLTNIAGIMALGTAFIPTNPTDLVVKTNTLVPLMEKGLGWLHYGFAAVLFLIFALLALNVFTIGQKNETQRPKSLLNENNIYRFCGYLILICIVLVPLSEKFKLFDYSTLLLETLSLIAFGIAWLIKGRALGDKGRIGQKLYQENNAVDTEKILEE